MLSVSKEVGLEVCAALGMHRPLQTQRACALGMRLGPKASDAARD